MTLHIYSQNVQICVYKRVADKLSSKPWIYQIYVTSIALNHEMKYITG